MINFRIIARVFSIIIIAEGFFMLLSSGVSFFYGERGSLFLSAIITIVSGILVFTPLRNEEKLSGQKEGFVIVTGMWLIASVFGTLPYLLSGTIRDFSSAFFESASGFTTTGVTVFDDPGILPRGILLWRSLTQWMGGLGFIIISMSVLQVYKTVNVHLPIQDFTGQHAGDKIHPKTEEAVKRLISAYIVLTIVEAMLLFAGGMEAFDAVCHSLTTISTGGFSTHAAGISVYSSPVIIIIMTVFMFLSGTSMTFFYFMVKRNFDKIRKNEELRFYLIACLGFVLLSSLVLWITGKYPAGRAFLEGSFQAVSTLTTTGFYHADFNQWGGVMILLIFILMFTGGTSGSASSGLKIIRLLLVIRNARTEMKRMIHPNAFIPVRLDHKPVPGVIINNLLVFIILYIMMICLCSLVISIMGYDLLTSFSTSSALLGNIGPSPGSFGPGASYASVPASAKIFFSFIMMAGRVELFSLFVIFTSEFYRR
ncbi:MAG TPA: TrkH family potassium uptake protein [Bacteroidales bacterium]|mgnify:CR=1 FL=1|nr:TrkH family potassium uptake protein [Bacteroidales bacterium]HPF03363.1 TrkH family potassium uptake protein [Bacteroidales bacterium]HPJ60356.1 TrkH family potassium uptake protein [Bacteroidales bacterium]HPR13124.1 TrkH family potassium uptake protein [Bacteroidales bacterium]HRW85068.1 TrkH family potassium uptake protein [Bacteroidales bacterium]